MVNGCNKMYFQKMSQMDYICIAHGSNHEGSYDTITSWQANITVEILILIIYWFAIFFINI